MASTVPADEAGGRQVGRSREAEERQRGYWRANLRLQLGLLAVWAIVGYVLSIFLANVLNDFTVYGFPIAFWFAQQGAIFTFVILIFLYAWRMDDIDHEFDVQEEELGWARRRLERRMQKRLTGEAPAAEAETGEPTGETTRPER
jgi:putative solute:sodium symporter small subunit